MAENITESVTVTDLKIISSIQEFKWNFAEIKQSLENHIEKYVGLVVTEENLKEMEAAQKEIASIRTKIDGFRKEVKKKMEEPYKVFEGEIKELQALILKAESPLKDQTLKYEQERIAAKEAELSKFAMTTALNLGIRNKFFNFVVKSQWINRTAKDSAVRKEIVTMIEAMLDNQRRADEVEELAKQRLDLIEGQCKAHSALLKTPVVPEDVNHLLVDVTLSDIPGIILAECQKRAEMERKAAEPVVEEVPSVVGISPTSLYEALPPNHPIYTGPTQGYDHAGDVDLCPEWVGSEIYLPPLPPAPAPMLTMPPPQPKLYKCVIEYPNITVQEAAAIKEFLSSRGIGYTIISQELVRSGF